MRRRETRKLILSLNKNVVREWKEADKEKNLWCDEEKEAELNKMMLVSYVLTYATFEPAAL